MSAGPGPGGPSGTGNFGRPIIPPVYAGPGRSGGTGRVTGIYNSSGGRYFSNPGPAGLWKGAAKGGSASPIHFKASIPKGWNKGGVSFTPPTTPTFNPTLMPLAPGISLPGLGKGGSINPQQYAQSVVQSQYGPLIDLLTNQQSQLQGDVAGGLKTIQNAYNTAGAQSQAGAQQVANVGQQGVQNVNSAASAILGALGGSANAGGTELGNKALLASNALNAQNTNLAQQNAGLQQDNTQRSADMQSWYQNAMDKQIAGIAQQLASQKANEGSDYTKALAQAYGLNSQLQTAAMQRRGMAVNQKLSAMLAGGQLQQMGLKNSEILNAMKLAGANFNFNAGQAGFKDKLAGATTASQLDSARLNRLLAWKSYQQQANGGQSFKLGTVLNNPKGFQSLEQSMLSGFVNQSTGKLLGTPANIKTQMGHYLMTAFPGSDQATRDRVVSLMMGKLTGGKVS